MPEEGGDTRVLNMRINNKEFLKGTSDSLKAVNTLNTGINKATKGPGMQSMSTGVDTVKTKFGALQVAGVTAIATITNKAVNAGLMLAKGLAIDPVMAGWREYEKLLTSTQTIAANTNNRSSAGIAKVGKALDQLNDYSDRTIYNFGQMAENAGRFTAAGVKLGPAVTSIKGLANAAALAGASNQQLGTAMYQTSQALGVGVVKLMDWRSLENANLGTANMRDALLSTAHSMADNGVAADAAIAKYGSFRDSLRENWLSADVFNKTMKVFAGTLTDGGKPIAYTVKQLQKMGYAKDAAIRLHEISAASIESATKIKTFSQLIDVVKESIGSGWAKIFRDLFGNLDEAGKMWTKVGGVITDIVSDVFGAVDRTLVGWKDKGGFTKFWGALGNIIESVGNLLRPFLILLDAIMPGTSAGGAGLYYITNLFWMFSVVLEKVTAIIGGSLGPAFGVIGKATGFLAGKVMELVDWFKQFEYAIAPLGPAFDRFAESVKKAFKALFSGDFSGFGDQISAAFSSLWKEGQFAGHNLVAGILDGLGYGSIETGIKSLVDRMLNYFKTLLGIHSPSTVTQGYGKDLVTGLGKGISDNSGSIFGSIGDFITGITDKFKSLDKFDLANVFSVIFGTLSLAAIVAFGKAFYDMFHVFTSMGKNVNNILANTGDVLKGMQRGLQAKALLDIAIAVGVLALALFVISKIPADKLKMGLGVVALLLAELTVAMTLMGKNSADTWKGIASLTGMAAAMVLMSVAILLLAGAVAVFGSMPTGMLVKGMISIGIALAILTGFALLLSLASPQLILGAAAILIMSTSLIVLAAGMTAMLAAILLYSKVSWKTITDGLLKIGATLIILGVSASIISVLAPGLLIAAAALIVLSVGLAAMLGVILMFSKVKWGPLMGGVSKIALTLIILGAAALIAAPGLLLLGAAFTLLGAGLFLAGLGMTLLGAGLTVVVAAVVAGSAVMFTAVESFVSLLPLIGVQFIAALDLILKALAEKMPSMVASLVSIVTSMLKGVSDLAPVIIQTGIDILTALLDGLIARQQLLWDKALQLLLGFIKAVDNGRQKLIDAGVRLIKHWIEGIGKNATILANAAAKALYDFLVGFDKAIVTYRKKIRDIGAQIAIHILEGLNPLALGKAIAKAATGQGDKPEETPGYTERGDASRFNVDGGPNKPDSIYGRGTDYARGGLSLVGDLGPELLSIRKGSAVITNKNLIGFMRSVAKLASSMTGSKSTNSSGGNIVYGVSADFQGDPRRDGIAFAANIAGGLVTGLQSQQPGLNQSMASMGTGMSEAFADILGIKSPSTVFKEFAADVGRGLILGLLANVTSVQKAAGAMGKAVIRGVAQTITDAQLKLESVRARSSAYEGLIAFLQGRADKEDDPEKKEKLEKEIKSLQKKADAAKKLAENQEKLVEEQNTAAERLDEFRKADTQGKADMRKEDAANAAKKASEQREMALRLKMEADIVRKYDSKRADIIEGKSETVLKRAKFWADLSNKYAKEAFDYARKVQTEIDAEMAKQLTTVTEIQVKDAQAAFDAYLRAIAEAQALAGQEQLPQNVTFEQNNYSPEAISAADAYRNGKSLVSMVERRLVNSP